MAENFDLARERYGNLGIDLEAALNLAQKTAISLHCWQADDVAGLEHEAAELEGGGIQVSGNYPGKARNMAELREDLAMAISMIPGGKRLSLHASYGDFSAGFVDRDEIGVEQFRSWLEWAQDLGIKLDFNATLFSHPLAQSGYTLSSPDPALRKFWVEHVHRAREISAFLGQKQGSSCVHNLWIPDGDKDLTVNRSLHRRILLESLDEIYAREFPATSIRDAVEPKLFGIGSEAYVVGSHEFYLGYALTRGLMLCLDMGHFHPTESVADKISSYFLYKDELLLHLSRPLRWDSDHVLILNDDLKQVMEELVRAQALEKTHIGLDFFDASMNRVGAYAIGARSAQKALLAALLEPAEALRKAESGGNMFARLALLEQAKLLPLGIVWDEFCRRNAVPLDHELVDRVMSYERKVLSRRS